MVSHEISITTIFGHNDFIYEINFTYKVITTKFWIKFGMLILKIIQRDFLLPRNQNYDDAQIKTKGSSYVLFWFERYQNERKKTKFRLKYFQLLNFYQILQRLLLYLISTLVSRGCWVFVVVLEVEEVEDEVTSRKLKAGCKPPQWIMVFPVYNQIIGRLE